MSTPMAQGNYKFRNQMWEHLGLLNHPTWLRSKDTKITYTQVQVYFNSVNIKTRLLKYKAACFPTIAGEWKKPHTFLEKQISRMIYIKTKCKIHGFFTCSLASIKSVKKNTVALHRLKVIGYFLAENRQKVNSGWHCSQKHFSLVCWSGYWSITVNQKKWNLCFFNDKREVATNKTFCRYVSENNKMLCHPRFLET